MLTVAGVVWSIVNSLRFTDTITVGSIIVAAMVIVAGGVVTFRNNMRTFWRNLAEEREEKIRVLEEHLHEKDMLITSIHEQSKDEMAKLVEEQRILRHELKNQIAEAAASLRVEQAKTDLSALLAQLARQHGEAMEKMAVGLENQAHILDLLDLGRQASLDPLDGS